jgi:uncharacterized membrane protein YgcG
MKLKGINAFEQHIEKIVLGAAVVVGGGLVAWHVLSAPTVKVGSRDVPLSEVDKLLDVKARDLKSRLDGDNRIEIPKLEEQGDGVKDGAAFVKSLVAPVSPVPSLARTAPSFNGMLVKNGVSAVDVWYYVPTVPSLEMRGIQETADALTAEAAKDAAKASKVVAARADFQKIDGPKDVVWTTPFARIDLKGLREELKRSQPTATPPLMQIPGVWYQDVAYLVDVVFERREKGADGSWGAPVVVPVFAARSEELNFRGRIDGAKAEVRDEVFALLGNDDNQKEILEPTFYDTVNHAFVSPALLAAADGEKATASDAGAVRRRMQLQTQLQEKQRRAQTLQAELEKLGGPWNEEVEKKKEEEKRKEEKERKDQEKSGTKGGGSGGNKGGPGGGPGGSMSGKAGASKDADDKDAKKKAAERKTKTMQLRRMESDISALETELGGDAAPTGTGKPKAPSLASLDELLVWGHDLEVVPGHTYQYRCLARVYNPFFGKGNQLVAKQSEKGLASAFTLDAVASEWSSEHTVSPDVRFFVTRALVGDGNLGLGSAQIEVYKLLGGQWRRAESSVQPGERIGRVDEHGAGGSVDFTTQYYLVDVVEDLDTTHAAAGTKDRRPGVVVIGSLNGAGSEIRIPANDLDDADRIKLRGQADAANAASKAPAAPEAPAGGKPTGSGSGSGSGGKGGGGKGGKGGKSGS